MDATGEVKKARVGLIALYCLAAIVVLAAYDAAAGLSAAGVLQLPTKSLAWFIPQLGTRVIALFGLSLLLLVELGPDRVKDALFLVLVLAVVYGLVAAVVMAPITRKAMTDSYAQMSETLKVQMSPEQAAKAATTAYSVGMIASVVLKPIGLGIIALIGHFVAKSVAKTVWNPADGAPPADDGSKETKP